MADPVPTKDSDDKKLFEQSIKTLESQIANAGAHVTIDSSTRLAYAREIKLMARKLEADALAGKMSWGDAAKQAQETRNLIMEIFRRQSYGKEAMFKNLTSGKKDRVYASIVKSAGKSNEKISAALSRLSYVGRSLIVISLGISAYNIAVSTNKLSTTRTELLSTGAGIGGGIAGGALSGAGFRHRQHH